MLLAACAVLPLAAGGAGAGGGPAAAAGVDGMVDGALHCQLGAGAGPTVRLEEWGANSMRVRIGADPTFELPQQALLPQPPKPVARVATDEASCVMVSGNLKAAVVGGKLQFVDASTNQLLLAETARSVCGGGPHCAATMPGVAGSVPPAGGITFASSAQERLYGLGEHRTGRLD